jgi:chromosome segregation ATPase
MYFPHQEEQYVHMQEKEQTVLGLVRNEANSEARNLREDATVREEEISILREQYVSMQRAQSKRVQDLEGKLKTVRERYRKLEKRRNFEFEGFTHDMKQLRRAMASLEVGVLNKKGAHGQREQPFDARKMSVKQLQEQVESFKARYGELEQEIAM